MAAITGVGERNCDSSSTHDFLMEDYVPVSISPDSCPLIRNQKDAVEHFGVLRTRLLTARVNQRVSSILITSALRQEGKSFISINLAVSLAQLSKHRILLIDADLRVRRISELLGVQKSVGLSDFLNSGSPFESCLRRSALSHLWVAPAGTASPEFIPAVLEGSRLPEFMRRAKQEFDLIIVDSVPASAPIADFELLLTACDSVLLVAHLRKTTRNALDLAAQKTNGKLLGVVVNNADVVPGSEYYSDYDKRKDRKKHANVDQAS